MMKLCPGCTQGNCYEHVDEFLMSFASMSEERRMKHMGYKVTRCQCPDPEHKHGKLEGSSDIAARIKK